MDTEQALKNLAMGNERKEGEATHDPSFHFITHKAGMQGVDKEKV